MLLEFCFAIPSWIFCVCLNPSENVPTFGSWRIRTTSAGRKVICHWSRWELPWQTVHSILNIHNMPNMVSMEWNNSFRVFAVPCIMALREQGHYNSKTAMPVWGIKHQEEHFIYITTEAYKLFTYVCIYMCTNICGWDMHAYIWT